MGREDLPFRVMMHNCQSDSLEYQPSVDWVGCSGVAELKRLVGEYEQYLVDSGLSPNDAKKKAHGVQGACIFMKEQFLALGMQHWEKTDDVTVNKDRWKQITSFCRHNIGQSMGGAKKTESVRKATYTYDRVKDRVKQPSLVDAVVDMIGSERKKSRNQE